MAPTLCGETVRSKRTLLALGWSIVNLLTFVAFLTSLIVALSARNYQNQNYNNQNYYNNDNNQQNDQEEDVEISVTSRAMAFAALWTALLAILMGIYGTVVLGFVAPTGNYYWCCARSVHSTTPMVLGSFMGAMLMFANLTLVLSVLFGEFNIRDFREGEGGKEAEEMQEITLERSSLAFSIMCMFLTVLYAGFTGLVFTYSEDLLRENQEDSRREALSPSTPGDHTAYIGSTINVHSTNNMTPQGYVKPQLSASSEVLA